MTKHSINPEDTDGGITAAAIEKETETPEGAAS